MEFQRVVARLVRAGMLSRTSALRLVKGVNRARKREPEERTALPRLLFDVLVATADGTLSEGVHFVKCERGRLALHVKSAVAALHRAGRTRLDQREARHLLRFGHRYFGGVVLAASKRVSFGEGVRHRAAILDVAGTEKLIGGKPPVLIR